MSSSLLNGDYRFTQFSIANPFIFAKCFTLSVTRIKLPLQAAEPMSKSKSSMDTKAILFLSVELDGVCKRYNVYQPNKSIYQIKVLFDTITFICAIFQFCDGDLRHITLQCPNLLELFRYSIFTTEQKNTNTRIQKVFLHITVLFHDLKFVNFGYPL